MKHKGLTGFALLFALCVSLMLTSCESYRAASPETTVPETAVVETTEVTKITAAPTAVPTMTASPTPVETTVTMIPVEPIDTSVRTDFAPTLYTVTGQTATGKTAVWKDDTRETASRYLIAGDTVTVVAIVGNESRPYALLDTGEYVLLGSLEAVPVETATPAATATPKPTKAPTKTPAATTTAPAGTTKATEPPPATSPSYYPNAENIRNLIVASLQARGIWFPDGGNVGGGSANTPVDYFLSDQEFADDYLNGKFPPTINYGCSSITATIEKGADCDYVVISYTCCTIPSA